MIGGRNTILIKSEEQNRAAVKFFDEVIAPLAERVRAEGISYFPLGSEPELETYFVEPSRKVMAPGDFELRATESAEAFISELAAFWQREGHEELAEMAPQLAELAREIPQSNESEQNDLSPFMYVMF
jgi:hypothetical protein